MPALVRGTRGFKKASEAKIGASGRIMVASEQLLMLIHAHSQNWSGWGLLFMSRPVHELLTHAHSQGRPL